MANKETTSINWEILLAALITEWESEGYLLGTDKYIQLNALLKQLPPSISVAQLKTLIAPIITTNAQQQEAFYRLFDIILQRSIVNDLSHKTVVKQEAKNIAINNFKNKVFHFINKQLALINPQIAKIALFIGAFILFGFSIFAYLYTQKTYKDLKDSADVNEYRRFCFPIDKGDAFLNLKEKTGTVQIHRISKEKEDLCIDYVPSRLGLEELTITIQLRNGTIEHFKVFISSFKIHRIIYSKPPPRGIKGQTQTFRPQINSKDSLNSFAAANDSTQKENVGGTYIEGISSTWEMGLGNSYFSLEKGLIVLISILFIGLLGLVLRYKNQKFTLRFKTDTNLPSSWSIRIPNTATILMDENFYIAVSEMRKRDMYESKRIDIKKTINASINNGGMIEFKYLGNANSKNYLAFIDINSPYNHRAKLHEFIANSLNHYEVPIECFYFNGDMRLCWNELFPRGISIKELRHKYETHQIVIFSTGETLLNFYSGALHKWVDIFDVWHRKVILTPRIATDWDKREEALSKKFRLLPATVTGLAALVETLEAVEPKSYKLWKNGKIKDDSIDIPDNVNAELLYAILESELTEYKNGVLDDKLIRWVAACALPPIPFWDWTLYVGELLNEAGSTCLTLNNLFTISQLKWFVEGKIPENIRELLIKWLEINHPYFLIKLINEWSWVLKLEANLPPVGSLAWQGHRVQVVLNDLLRQSTKEERRKLELELDNLLAGDAVKDALVVHYLDGHSSLLDNMLSDKFRKFIQTKKSILWRWRDWTWQVPIVLSVLLLTLFIHYSEPVTTFNFDSNITALSFANDGKSFLTANQDGKIGICDDNRWIQSVNTKYNIIDLAITTINNEPIVSAVNNKGDVLLWNQLQGTSNYNPITTLKNINCAAISTDLKRLVVGYYTTNNAELWDIDKKTFTSFLGHSDAITDVKISPDKQFVMTASRDNTAKLWSIDGTLLETYIGHKGPVYSVDISTDGSKILTASRDNTAKLWNAESGYLIHTFEGHTYDVFDAHFSPDGQSIVTASGDKTAKLWSINGALKRTFYGHQDYVRKAIFSPDNTHILTGDDAGKVKLWQLAKR